MSTVRRRVRPHDDWIAVKEDPIFIGIDQSLGGFGLSVLHSGAHTTIHKAMKGTGVDRLAWMQRWLSEELSAYPLEFVKHICMEGYNYGARNGREVSGETGATVKLALRDLFKGREEGYPTIVTPIQVKQFVLNKGGGKKNEILLGVFKKWGESFSSDDEADAYALARIAQALYFKPEDLLVYEAKVLNGLKERTEWTRAR